VTLLGFSAVLIAALLSAQAGGPTLEQQLSAEDPMALANAARELGDPVRGAVVFYQPYLTCTKCHTPGEGGSALGPDLARLGQDVTGDYLVESILQPSRAIRKGYETVTISTDAGKTLIGLLAEDRPDALVVRDASQDGKLVTVAKANIDGRNDTGPSLMPAGLMNQLTSRQQFLDLVRYVMDIAEKGPSRALALRPDPSSFALPPLPDYERNIDHAGMIAGLDEAGFRRGEAIYNRLCINCHGTKDQPGSLPTSPRFATGSFKNGSDPYAMYRTLTLGFGQMVPQTWMVPEQKYDVIHYIRQACLKDHNPGQYARIDQG
jgi:putative heme-binding domain-containing protein